MSEQRGRGALLEGCLLGHSTPFCLSCSWHLIEKVLEQVETCEDARSGSRLCAGSSRLHTFRGLSMAASDPHKRCLPSPFPPLAGVLPEMGEATGLYSVPGGHGVVRPVSGHRAARQPQAVACRSDVTGLISTPWH